MQDNLLGKRRKSKKISVGGVEIGGDAPIAIQSMTITKTDDVQATLIQAHAIATQGADIVRVAVPHEGDARALPEIVKEAGVPVIADIHFSYRLALMALEAGVQGLRLNPGNIRDPVHIRTVVKEALDRKVPIRVGANAGSLDRGIVERFGGPTPEALVFSALEEVKILEDEGFGDIKISVKHQNVPQMIAAYRLLATQTEYPLHLGVTEAGPPPVGTVKSAIGIGTLLAEGIGDTIRVSLTADPVEEIKTAFEILKALGLRERGPIMIACPSCGRDNVGVQTLAEKVEERLHTYPQHFEVAVLGCAVNGPGEAGDADFGIAGGRDVGFVYAHGRVLKKVSSDILIDELFHEIDRWIAEGMHRPKRLKMAKPAALAMAEASLIPFE
jgi:(E)-4-hydroxy-3-methylbut-2-enyl-diphosphate synthase